MTRRPKGGVGSNQYATRPGTNHTASRQAMTVTADGDPDEIAWVFDPDHAAWASYGFRTWDQVRPWHDAGFEPAVAKAWRVEGVEPVGLEAAVRYGMTAPDLKWMQRDFFYPESCIPWIEAGFKDRHAVNKWIGLAEPREARLLKNNGVTPKAWVKWRKHKFSLYDTLRWTRAGVLNPSEADRWRAHGHTPRQVRRISEEQVEPL